MKPHFFHPAADEEYSKAVQYYAAVSPELGIRFYAEIERLIEGIRTQPDRSMFFSAPARRSLARNFPYSVIYLDEPERIWILAVMHAKRRPGYWKERLVN